MSTYKILNAIKFIEGETIWIAKLNLLKLNYQMKNIQD